MNRKQRRARRRANIRPRLAALDGARIPGGCDTCDAYQTIDATHAPLFTINVHHDEACQTWQAIQVTEGNQP